MVLEKQLTATGCIVKAQFSLANLTTFKVGGPAEWFAAPRSVDELQACVQWANAEGLPITRLGAGSNLLISDRGLPGLVLCTRYLRHVEFESTGNVTAAAGMPMATLAWKVAKRGWRGLVWTVGIPGTVGGAVVMNAGAHGSDTQTILVNTEVLNPDGSLAILTPDQLQFKYRTSVLQADPRIVTRATFQLQPGYDPQTVRAETSADLEQRRSTQPYHLPSCGSVFRNPLPKSAGWLIEQSGLKGFKVGQAQVAERHANFILNCGGATATDIFTLIRHIQGIVDAKWSLQLRPEVQILGDFQSA
ncbi:UDP-N-acetylmuramate dehydrogenase [Leptolyngbya cf. ectocarpi LEGE 11479]|uniref:UDP-N-acetylenolpyruvoylglucosamine reductase n=1 Tax=Leptolyngbya cf. ectocarpi LEGE 11479 TaxID=1828722 RepID=A0A928X327_LEPEC|nr:UDP-N-acetylmuramate dehydrogenase [Leptolyngbya ectocarpi]MBE9066965.1 UDP-N-acetylmuramate dehydrogenase [Leptolyngbya cf. ectocarpi LEGE 11479]